MIRRFRAWLRWKINTWRFKRECRKMSHKPPKGDVCITGPVESSWSITGYDPKTSTLELGEQICEN